MKRTRVMISIFVTALFMLALVSPAAAQPPDAESQQAVDTGIAWLVGQQNPDGCWMGMYKGQPCPVGTTAFALMVLEHHCMDSKWGHGLPSPFDPACPYRYAIQNGLNYIFLRADFTDISPQPAGNPDSDGDGIGVYFATSYKTYETAIALMAIVGTRTPDRVVDLPGCPVDGWTYHDVAVDIVNYLAFGQNDAGTQRGGWGYHENRADWSDNSNTGYAVLGLHCAEANPPEGFGIPIPQFVKDELCIWIDYIQCDPGDPGYTPAKDGGSGYVGPCGGVNILKTGNLLEEMEFVGGACGRQQAAIDYLVRHWNDADTDPGWKGPGYPWTPSHYQAMYTTMKGLVAKRYVNPAVIDGIYWQDDFYNAIVAQRWASGFWLPGDYGDMTQNTEWALLVLQTGVQDIFDPWHYDLDEDGAISKTEAITAVVDYFDGLIIKEQALEVIALYFG